MKKSYLPMLLVLYGICAVFLLLIFCLLPFRIATIVSVSLLFCFVAALLVAIGGLIEENDQVMGVINKAEMMLKDLEINVKKLLHFNKLN